MMNREDKLTLIYEALLLEIRNLRGYLMIANFFGCGSWVAYLLLCHGENDSAFIVAIGLIMLCCFIHFKCKRTQKYLDENIRRELQAEQIYVKDSRWPQ